MNEKLRAFLCYAGSCFALLFVLSFTPLFWFPELFSLVTEGWIWIAIILGIGGAPFAGFLMLWIISPRGKYLIEASKLSGIWIGTIAGSVLGMGLSELT